MLVNKKEFIESLSTALNILKFRNFNPPKLKDNVSDYILLTPNNQYLSIVSTDSYVLYYSNIPIIDSYTLSKSIVMYAYQAHQIKEFFKKNKSNDKIGIYENNLNKDLLLKDNSVGIHNIDYYYPVFTDLFNTPVEKIFKVETEEIKDRIKILKNIKKQLIKNKKDYYHKLENLRLNLDTLENILHISIDDIEEDYTVIVSTETTNKKMLDNDFLLTFSIFENIIDNIEAKETLFCLNESKEIVKIIPVIDDKLYLVKQESFFTMQRKEQ